MRRVVVLAALLFAVWLARDAGWLRVTELLPPRGPHETYAATLQRTGLADTPLGARWLEEAATALSAPAHVATPHQRGTSINTHEPSAYGYRVTLRRGQRIDVTARVDGDIPGQAFVDIFEGRDGALEHRSGGVRAAQYEATRESSDLLVRVQTELLRHGRLHLAIRAAPALRFPVADTGPRALQSGFGVPRDGGSRTHEGVDIFARRGTPVIAATDGVVTRVTESGLGGRVVWVWNRGRGLMVYYAHLDEQLVSIGERVAAGDVLGTVGNTGNARTTSPHLHFGLYERGGGAVDPQPFIVAPPT